MKSLSLVAVFWAIIFSFGCFSERESIVNEQIVREIISSISFGVENRDISPIDDSLTDDVKIIRYINFNGHKQVEKMSKGQYLEMVTTGFKALTHYEYNVTNIKIEIKDEKAFVSSEVREVAGKQGKILKAYSKQKVTVELVNGDPKITELVSEIDVYNP